MIFLGVGSSIGNAEQIFLDAEKLLAQQEIRILRKSKILKNPPAGGVAVNEFSNAVWEISIPESMAPQKLLTVLKSIEKELGRDLSAQRWSDRILDLDILIFHNKIINTPSLIIPHPRMVEREFVLKPLGELIDENFEIPTLGTLQSLQS